MKQLCTIFLCLFVLCSVLLSGTLQGAETKRDPNADMAKEGSTALPANVTAAPGDTLYTFIVPGQIILGVAKPGSLPNLVFTSGGQSSAVLTDNKWIVTDLYGTFEDTTHLQIGGTAAQGFGFRDLTWDGTWLLTSDNNQIRRVDINTFTEIVPRITSAVNNPHRGLSYSSTNRIWTSNFTTGPVAMIDTNGAIVKTLGIPAVAPYGLGHDKWTTAGKMWLWYSEPSLAGTLRLSKVDTSNGTVVQSFDYSAMAPATATVGGLDIVNDHPDYPGRVVAFLVLQSFPTSKVLVIDLGPDATSGVNSVTVGSPNGAEIWNVGSSHNITWAAIGSVDTVRIEYSSNNGTNWNVVASAVPATPGSYSWTVPSTATTQALVRVSWIDSLTTITDQSNAVFTINALIATITTSPDSIVATLAVGSNTVNGTLTIGNTGTASLTWSLSETPTGPQNITAGDLPYYRPGPQMPKGVDDGTSGGPITDNQGGPDAFGYRWIDSQEPGGPIFSWVDISGTGTALDSSSAWISTGTGSNRRNDEGFVAVFLPFPFSYYGVSRDTLYIGTNGFCSFNRPVADAFTNAIFPTAAGTIDNHLGAWWDDLEIRGPGRVYYGTNGPNFVVQYNQVCLFNSSIPNYTFEIILTPSGEWFYQYLNMAISGGTLVSATVGMENPGGTIGLSVVHNAAYMGNNRAIRFYNGITWLSESPTSGSIVPSSSQPVTVTFNSAGLAAGTYRGKLTVTSNDPVTPSKDVPVRLTVGLTGVTDQQTGIPATFELGQNYPNPFNPTTRIEYGLPEAANVTITVFNVIGQEVATLSRGVQSAGYHAVEWNGRNSAGTALSSGVYFYSLKAASESHSSTFSEVRKMLLIK